MAAKASPLLRYVLGACYRKALSRVHNARLVFLGVVFSQYDASPPGLIDVERIDRAAELLRRQERRLARLRNALSDAHDGDAQTYRRKLI